MKLVHEAVWGSRIPRTDIMIERQDMPWDNEWKCSAEQGVRTAVMLSLAYHQLTSVHPEVISKNEIMSYLGYGLNSTKTKMFMRLPEILRDIGFICDMLEYALPKTMMSFKFNLDTLEQTEPVRGKDKTLKEYSPYILLEPEQVLRLMKTAQASKGGKLAEYLRVYLVLRASMRSSYTEKRQFLGMFSMIPQKTISFETEIEPHTLLLMINALEQSELIYKVSGKTIGTGLTGTNCYASTNDVRLIDNIREKQIKEATPVRERYAARKGRGDSILNRAATDAAGRSCAI